MGQRPETNAAGAAALEEAVGLAFRVLKVVMAVLVVLFALSGLFQVESNEVGFVRRLGVLDPTPLEPGPHLGWPVLDEVVRVDRRARRTPVTTFDLRRTQAELIENKAPERSGGLDPTRDGYLLTGDANILHVTLAARVKVSDPPHRSQVTFADSPGREDMSREAISCLLERAALQAAAHRKVGSMLGAGKADYLDDVRKTLQRSLAEGQLGYEVEGVDPERDLSVSPQVRKAFDRVSQNSQAVDKLRSNAESLATRQVSEATVAAEQRVSEARSEADRVRARAKADAERFTALLPEWKRQRQTLKERLLTDMLVRAAGETGEVFFVTDGDLRIRIERDILGKDAELQKKALERQQ